MKARWQRFILGALIGIAGCTNVSSTDIKTGGMSAYLSVTADGSGSALARAHFNVDNSLTDFVNLDGSDKITVSSGDQTVRLTESTFAGAVGYSGTLDVDAPGTTFTFDLERPSDTSAPASTCTLPPGFAITAPAEGAVFSRATDDITVTYSGEGQHDAFAWSLEGDCVNLTGQSVDDTGSFVIPRSALIFNGSTSTNCDVTLTLTRTREGTLDAAYYGGGVSAVQSRSLTFKSAP